MNFQIFEIEYEFPEIGPTRTIGRIEESDNYIIVISQWLDSYDICRYTVIPKHLVRKIVELNFK